MTSIGTSRHPEEGIHTRVSVFVGKDKDHRARAGVLTFRDGDDNEFIRRVEDQYQEPTAAELIAWLTKDHRSISHAATMAVDYHLNTEGEPERLLQDFRNAQKEKS